VASWHSFPASTRRRQPPVNLRLDRGGQGARWRRSTKRRSKYRTQAKSAGLGKPPNRVGIEHRPAEVDARLVVDYWEDDTVAIVTGDAGRTS